MYLRKRERVAEWIHSVTMMPLRGENSEQLNKYGSHQTHLSWTF